MNDSPDKIVSFETLKIKRNMRKICNCENPQYDVDITNRAVWCRECGAWIDPFEAILDIANHAEKLEQDIAHLEDKQKEAYEKIQKLNGEIEILAKKRARLNIFKKLESEYRSNMLPHCPKCGQVFHFEEITGWVNRKYVEEESEAENE
jgi:hypothetical protein